ncbi:MAG: phytanoyl-CoA dioxygenase family protein [Polyangiales bacterium]
MSFEDEGFCVVRELVPAAKIDALLAERDTLIKPSRHAFYRHCRDRWEKSAVDAHGHIEQSFIDVHDGLHPELASFSHRVREILCSEDIARTLERITGDRAHRLVLSMMYDANVETPPHQDAWGLDSNPRGHLLGGWFALEDIDERAGRFYVMRGSHRHEFDRATCSDRTRWEHENRLYVDGRPEQLYAPALAKGDAMFWSASVIHGSLPTRDPRFSRKSLTAHYLPRGFELGSMFGARRKQPTYTHETAIPYRKVEPSHPLVTAARDRWPEAWNRARRWLAVVPFTSL